MPFTSRGAARIGAEASGWAHSLGPLTPPAPDPSPVSWWIGVPREQWAARVAEAMKHMAGSKGEAVVTGMQVSDRQDRRDRREASWD